MASLTLGVLYPQTSPEGSLFISVYTSCVYMKKHTSRKIFNKTTCEHTPLKTRPLFISLFIFRFLRRFSCRDFDISRPIFRAQKWKVCKMGRKIICIKETPAKCHISKRFLAQYEKKTEKIRFKFKSKVTGLGISFSMKADQINPHVMQNLD